MNTRMTRGLLLALASSIALTACASAPGRVSDAQAGRQIKAAEAQANALTDKMNNLQATQRPANITVRDGIYLGSDGFRVRNGDPLPRQFEGANGVSLNLGRAVNIMEFAEVVHRTTGIPVDFHDLFHAPAHEEPEEAEGSNESSGTADSTGASDRHAQAEEGGVTAHPTERTFRINHKGSLSDLLSYVANRMDADWTYKGGRIQFLGPQTRTYTLWSLPSDLNTSSTVGGGSGTTFGGAAPSTTSSTYAYQYWESFEDGIRAVLPETGAKYSINRASGNVTVTGSQAAHLRVSDFVERENARLSRQVAIKVDVVAFSQADSDARSGNLSAIFDAASAGIGFQIETPTRSIDGASGLTSTVLSNGRGPLSDFSGSESVLKALANYGRVSLMSTSSVVAGNNMPTPVSIVKEKAYLASISTTESDDETTTTLDAGIINTGLNMVVTPRVMSSGEVLVQYTMNITDLKGIEEFAAPDGSSAIQLPETETRNFMQTVNIASGESLVIAAYEGTSTSRNRSGPLNPRLWGLGGQADYSAENTKILVMMTPVVLEGRNNPRAR